ncbi:hypothetical protein FTO70_10660 [Methanosarcina sp. KYL-1]|uniref:hypothetical protein n=1 Tax=Methanosarcina sp. KYL-1 TaxID=2602068 RepID=UPI002100E96A|nr:hypothetical protein [Methanosarcina sp. KYL-1]MCQ1536132.1 hypothetical protein [Methanosarcina sp. KYL-1]
MSGTKENSLFKDYHTLQLFFSSNHIRLHSAQEYFKERGVFAFANEKDAMASLASNFFIGIDSQENLLKYTGVKAFPKLSGFILEADVDVTLENLYDYLSTHIGNEFGDIKESKITHIVPEPNKLSIDIEYFIDEVTSYNIFETVKREANFEISKIGNTFIATLILNRDTDYSVVFGILSSIISNDSDLKLKLIESDLSIIPTTDKRHEFFRELMKVLDKEYEVLGIIKYNRNKADDLNTSDSFEDNHLKGSQEVKRMDINEILENLKKRSAFLEGANIILHDRRSSRLFVVQLLSKSNKRRFEIGLSGDVKKYEEPDTLEKVLTKSDINDLDSDHLTESDKQSILKEIWNIVSRQFYEYKVKWLESSKQII